MVQINTCVTKHVSNSLWLGMYWKSFSEKIYISYANVDFINYSIQKASAHQTLVNLIIKIVLVKRTSKSIIFLYFPTQTISAVWR